MAHTQMLILNHAVYAHGSYVETRLADPSAPLDVDAMKVNMNINSWSYVALATHALPALVESGGQIGVVSSLAGKFGMPKASVAVPGAG